MRDRAIEWFENRSPEKKRFPPERLRLATVFLRAGRLDEAQVLWEALLKDDFGGYRATCLAHLGVVAVRRGDREEALRISRLLEDADGPLSLAGLTGGWGTLHEDPILEPLWDSPPFVEVIRRGGSRR